MYCGCNPGYLPLITPWSSPTPHHKHTHTHLLDDTEQVVCERLQAMLPADSCLYVLITRVHSPPLWPPSDLLWTPHPPTHNPPTCLPAD